MKMNAGQIEKDVDYEIFETEFRNTFLLGFQLIQKLAPNFKVVELGSLAGCVVATVNEIASLNQKETNYWVQIIIETAFDTHKLSVFVSI